MFFNMKNENFGDIILPFLTITFLITLLIYYVQWKIGRRHMVALASKIPAPAEIPLYPIIGHSLSFLGDCEKILLSTMDFNLHAPCPPRSAWLAYRYFAVVNRPEDMEVILNSPKCLSKDNLYKMSVPLFGTGLFSSPVAQWKKHRKIIMPAFNQKILDSFVEVFSTQAEICAQQLHKTNQEMIDIFPYAIRYGLDAVCETAMGIHINAQTTSSEIENWITRGMDIIMVKMFNVPYHSDFIYKMSNLCKVEQELIEKYHSFINTVIRRKKREFAEKKLDEVNNVKVEQSGLKRKAFLDLLIEYTQTGETWSEYELLSEVSTFMVAGSDTGATVSSFTLTLLAMHPEIQEKCYEEIMEVLGSDRMLEYSDLPKLVYLEWVIKESMRLFPVGPLIVRQVDEDVEVGGYILPKGAGIVLSIMAMHHAEKLYKDSKKFDPMRFSPEEVAKRHKYAYLPFSGGPRNCVAPKYGMMSVKTLVAIIIKNFRVETDYKSIKEIRVKQSIIIKPVSKLNMRFIPRK